MTPPEGHLARVEHAREEIAKRWLVRLIEHARNGLRLMIAAEIPLISPESSINVIVLDAVSPRYMKAAAADPTHGELLGTSIVRVVPAGTPASSSRVRARSRSVW